MLPPEVCEVPPHRGAWSDRVCLHHPPPERVAHVLELRRRTRNQHTRDHVGNSRLLVPPLRLTRSHGLEETRPAVIPHCSLALGVGGVGAKVALRRWKAPLCAYRCEFRRDHLDLAAHPPPQEPEDRHVRAAFFGVEFSVEICGSLDEFWSDGGRPGRGCFAFPEPCFSPVLLLHFEPRHEIGVQKLRLQNRLSYRSIPLQRINLIRLGAHRPPSRESPHV
mmetsp:Transcript_62438/g.143075  ORF Transcript_62438/g.143075 Transcript_62438/m.143075 type:complete len:221 (+) Transcript_62438:598-1260(+)